jgi:signal transduction histidine kinase
VHVVVRGSGDGVLVEVQDDGGGFDTAADTAGFGLAGMRERVYLAGGRLEVTSGSGGTTVRAHLPVAEGAAGRQSGADQVAS